MKTITKNLIYLAIAMVLMPVGAVNAQERGNGLEIVATQVNVEPKVETKIALVELKNVIDQTKVVNKPVVKQTIPVNNSRDWSKSKYTPDQIKEMICQVFTNNCEEALIIAKNESGFRPWAISKTNDYGVFQLNCRWQKRRVGGDCNKFLDPVTNIRIAKQIYNEQGWNPWTTKIYLRK